MSNNRGFTLVEVLASIVILGILASAFFQFFVFSQKTTTGNQEKLVAINIAQGVLERVKNNVYPEINVPQTYNESICNSTDETCKKRYKIDINNQAYSIKIEVGGQLEDSMDLHSVKVTVYGVDGRKESAVKGFVEL